MTKAAAPSPARRPHMALLRREIALAFAEGTNIGLGLLFFLSIVVLFPFGLGPDLDTLRLVGPAVLWAGPMLSILLGLEKLFQPDNEDGTLDLYCMAALPLEAIMLIKAVAHWLCAALPLIVVAPLFGLMLAMPPETIVGCLLGLLAGTPALVFIGAFAAAVTVRVRRSGMLLTVLSIPLVVPTLIFGVSASVGYAAPSLPFKTPFLIVCAFSLFSAVICSLAGAAALRAGSTR